MRPVIRILIVVAVAAAARSVGAEESVPRFSTPPRVFEAPTAWLQPRDTVFAAAGLDHHGAPFAAVSAGLGGVAELDVTVSSLTGEATPTVLFKTGWPPGRRRAGVSLGFRKSFAGTHAARGFLSASLDLGQVRLHAGAELWAVADPMSESELSGARPLAGLEWTPAIYPRSTILADLVWAPHADLQTLEWVASAGVHFQPLAWGAIELGVQVREHDLLDRPSIFVRINGRWGK